MMNQVNAAPHNPISIHDNKREYLKEKERKDLKALEIELTREKEKAVRLEDTFGNEIENLKEKQSDELSRVENGHRDTLEMLNKEKDKIMGTLGETLEKENTKMEQMHQGDLTHKERISKENTEGLKVQLQKETVNLE